MERARAATKDQAPQINQVEVGNLPREREARKKKRRRMDREERSIELNVCLRELLPSRR